MLTPRALFREVESNFLCPASASKRENPETLPRTDVGLEEARVQAA